MSAFLDLPDVDLSGLNILIVDDASSSQIIHRIILQRAGANVVVAGSGAEAIASIKSTALDVVLLDIQMPEISGLDVIAMVRSHPDERVSRLPVIAITAHAMPGDREAILSYGFDRYFSKPVDFAELLFVLKRLREGGSLGDVKN